MLTPNTLLQERYRIVRQIGGGGMGLVYLAEDTRLPGRRCAIKEMSPAQLAPQDRNWAIAAFKQEAQMLANINHPGLTSVTDFFPEKSNWYLVMDYVEGETLAERMDRSGGRLPLQEALGITRQLCNVLAYLHNRQPPVVFRDLKPGNVMLTPDGKVKLIDFGIARFFKPGQTQDTVNLGTPGYAAPEQWGAGGQSDPRTDVYSLGVLLHHMVTGYDPATASTPFPLPPLDSLTRDLPPHVEDAISRAVDVHPDRRFPSVREFQEALFPPTRVMPGQDARAPSGDQYQPPARPGSKRKIWMGVGIAAVLLIGLCVLTVSGAVIGADQLEDYWKQIVATSPPIQVSTNTPPTKTSSATEPTIASTDRPPSSPTVRASAGEATPLTPSPTTPVVSPRLCYVRGSVGNTDVYVADADGSNQNCIACRSCDEAEPSWSYDGRYVVYQSDCGGSYDIWYVSSDGGEPTQLTRTSGTDEREPNWSPDGSQIVFRSSPRGSDRNADGVLYLMDADGSNTRSLDVWGRAPVWSPNGDEIAFMSERSGSWEVYVYDLQSGTTDQLTNCSANCRWPAWSPNGRYVTYHSTTAPGSVTADTIWYVAATGGSATRMVSGSHAGRPTWSIHGLISFNSERGIEIVREDGGGRRTLIPGEQNWAPAWSE